jgi:hypothetical protein
MPIINVSRIIKSPKFAQEYSVFRKSGAWVNHRWVPSETEIKIIGVVTAPNAKEILQIPEGDRITGVMCFHSTQELFTSRVTENGSGTSDEIVWRGNRYRVSQVMPWADFGYWKAFGVRMEGC